MTCRLHGKRRTIDMCTPCALRLLRPFDLPRRGCSKRSWKMGGTLELEPEKSRGLASRCIPSPPSGGLAAVLSRFARMVKMSVRSHNLGRHGIDEDDIEQEIRIRLWSALERQPAKELPGAYVQKVVFSVVVDAVRRERVRRLDLQHEADCHGADYSDITRQPDALLAQRQWTDHLHQCICRLPPRRRRPVQLFLLGYTLQEVANVNGITLDAGSKLVRRGLADLRRLLRE